MKLWFEKKKERKKENKEIKLEGTKLGNTSLANIRNVS